MYNATYWLFFSDNGERKDFVFPVSVFLLLYQLEANYCKLVNRIILCSVLWTGDSSVTIGRVPKLQVHRAFLPQLMRVRCIHGEITSLEDVFATKVGR